MTAGVAAQRVLEWLSALPKGPGSRVHVVCDFDGDGLSAMTIAAITLAAIVPPAMVRFIDTSEAVLHA